MFRNLAVECKAAELGSKGPVNWGALRNWALECKAAELGSVRQLSWGVFRNLALECKAAELGSARRLSWGVCQVLKHRHFILQMMSDYLFGTGMDETLRSQAIYNRTYSYVFQYKSKYDYLPPYRGK